MGGVGVPLTPMLHNPDTEGAAGLVHGAAGAGPQDADTQPEPVSCPPAEWGGRWPLRVYVLQLLPGDGCWRERTEEVSRLLFVSTEKQAIGAVLLRERALWQGRGRWYVSCLVTIGPRWLQDP